MQVVATVAEIVFTMHFQPADGWPAVEKMAVVRGAQTDAREGVQVVWLKHIHSRVAARGPYDTAKLMLPANGDARGGRLARAQ